jgi:hypothetical protein
MALMLTPQSILAAQNVASRRVWSPANLNTPRSVLNWFWKRPLLLILLAHTLFSIGIWNARDGYGEETNNVSAAFKILRSHQPVSSLYRDLIALTLSYLTPDPISALTFMKYLSSLLATLALYLGLSAFSSKLRQSAIIFACLVWIASSLDAPYLQSTSRALFSFAIMMFGIDCLLLCRSTRGIPGFYLFGILAALLHPEYFLPVGLMTFCLVAYALTSAARRLKLRFGWPPYWTCAGLISLAFVAGIVLWVNRPASISKRVNQLDSYALLGLGQCYADFYHRAHPNEALSAMTEYRELLDRTFNHPTGFCAAVRNNPLEILRYFLLNGGRNFFRNMPGALLGRYREQSHHRGVLYWPVRVILLAGGLAGANRLHKAGWKRHDLKSLLTASVRNPIFRKLLVLLLFSTTSIVAIVLLVGTPRYYLCCVPLFYLGVAYSADSLLRGLNLIRYERELLVLFAIVFCAPNFLTPRPNEEFDAIRHVAVRVKKYPTVAASWAEPDAVLALYGKADSISLWDGIRQSDIEEGKIDIFLIDDDLRKSKTWADQREFFDRFEREPENYGFKKVDDTPTGRFKIYYHAPIQVKN